MNMTTIAKIAICILTVFLPWGICLIARKKMEFPQKPVCPHKNRHRRNFIMRQFQARQMTRALQQKWSNESPLTQNSHDRKNN